MASCRDQTGGTTFPAFGKKPFRILSDGLKLQKTFDDQRIRCRLCENMGRNLHQRRATTCDEDGRKSGVGFIGEIEGAGLGIENSQRTFNDETVQFGTANTLRKSSAYAVEKVENTILLFLQIMEFSLQAPHARLALNHANDDCEEEQSAQGGNENCPHEGLRV